MRREDAYQHLPVVHRTVLQLVDDGHSEVEIAEQIDVEPEAVPALIAVARAKLATLTERPVPERRP